jgi:nucleotide-binding universal stress UspA family protein
MIRSRWAGFRSLLCPIDFSEPSRRALQHAVAVARRGKAALRVVYVNDPLLIAAASAALRDRHVASRSAVELEAFIRATVPAGTRTRLKLTSHVSIGTPSERILEAASGRRTDLIVLGTHGLTGASRLFMGSTTMRVLQRTTVPVLAIPPGGDAPAEPVPASWPGARILAAVELDDEGAGEVDSAARVARWFGSSLLLAHVVTEVAAPAWMSADRSAHDRMRVAQAERRLEALAAIARQYVTADTRVACGNIADEIAALASNERTDLLITALHDRRRWFGAKRGAIAYHILSHAVTPVLACPPHWRPR